MQKKVFIITLLLFFALPAMGQRHRQHKILRSAAYWKSFKNEVLFGVGTANMLGDLGGLNRIGTDRSPVDFDLGSIRPGIHFGYRHRFARRWSTRTMFQYGLLRGNDGLTLEFYRNYRNLNVRTHLFELSQHLEFIFYVRERTSRFFGDYGLWGRKRRNSHAYLFSGLTGFGYIPQGPKDGNWFNLRPLNTEGQGLPGGGQAYGKFSYGIPMGIGFKVFVDREWRISVELSYTKTFTDHLDDVSGTYYNNEAINDAYGATAAYLADPSSRANPSITSHGEMRGDSGDLDAYTFFNITVVRNLRKGYAPKFKPRTLRF